MIKEIEKPNIDFKFYIYPEGTFYYDNIKDEYSIYNNYNGNGEYYYFNLDGNRHRANAPAVVTIHGYEYWINGKVHRTDGPAEQYVYSKPKFWMHNMQLSPAVFAYKTKHLICEYCNDFCKQECFL